MARVNERSLETYEPLPMKELKDPIIFVVDMIKGPVRGRALCDGVIGAVIVHIEASIKDAQQRVTLIVDSHPSEMRGFNFYPTHCVIGTTENEITQESKSHVQELMRENSTNTFTCPDFQSSLTERMGSYCDIVITDCCADICTLQFVLCLNTWLNGHNKAGQRIIAPLNYVGTYHIEGVHDAVSCSEFGIRDMEADGIYIASSLERED